MKSILAGVIGICCVIVACWAADDCVGTVCKGMCYSENCTCCADNCYLPEGSVCCAGGGACPGDNTCCLHDGAYWCCDKDSVCCPNLWTCCPTALGCGTNDCGVNYSKDIPAWARPSRRDRS